MSTNEPILSCPAARTHRRLEELAVDLWWSWHPRRRKVFRLLDYPLWRATAHNPVPHAVA
jgi:glucan phosphorylase